MPNDNEVVANAATVLSEFDGAVARALAERRLADREVAALEQIAASIGRLERLTVAIITVALADPSVEIPPTLRQALREALA